MGESIPRVGWDVAVGWASINRVIDQSRFRKLGDFGEIDTAMGVAVFQIITARAWVADDVSSTRRQGWKRRNTLSSPEIKKPSKWRVLVEKSMFNVLEEASGSGV